MAVTINDFWNLAIESRLLAPEHCQQLAASYEQTKGPLSQTSVRTLADWLTSINVLSRYQATVLAGGRSGPFFYGEYKVYDRLDAGRWKGLFRAVHAPTNHPVLLQFITGPVTQDPQQWAYVVGQVHHRLTAPYPHWQRYFEVVDLGNFKFLVAEDLAGESLDQRLTQAGRLHAHDACLIVRHAALALAQLHRWQLPHGDVRPVNLWLDAQGHARLLQDPTSVPGPWPWGTPDSDGSLAARADYAAPELQQPGRTPDAQTDIYSLGCCFYHMLAGQPPFAGGDVASKFQRHATAAIQPLAASGVPEPVAQIVTYMMAKNPAVRFPAAQLVADQLAPYCDPHRLNVHQVAVAPTLPGYEQFLQQRGLGRVSPALASPGASPVATTASPSAPAPPAPAPAMATPAAASPPAMVASPVTAAPAAGPGATAAGAPRAGSPPASTHAATSASPPTSSSPAAAAPAGKAAAHSEGRTPSGKPSGAAGRTPSPTSPATSAATSSAPPGTATPARAASPQRPVPAPVPVPAAPPGMAPPVAPGASGSSVLAPRSASGQRQPVNPLVWAGAGGGVALAALAILILMMRSDDSESGATSPTGQPGPTAVAGTPGSTGTTPAATAGRPTTPPATTSGTGTAPTRTGSPLVTPRKTPTAEKGTDVATTPAGFRQTVVPDDGASLWESPTSGKPVEFHWVPPGGQFFLLLRPADLLASPEGARLVKALGPGIAALVGDFEKIVGCPLGEVERLTVTLHDNGDEFPRPSLVVVVKEPVVVDEWVGRWNAQPGDEASRAQVFRAGPWHYCVPTAEGNRLFVVGSADEIAAVAKSGGSPPALRREIDKLRRLTDEDRQVTLLLAPNYLNSSLFRDGRTFYFGEAHKIREPLDWFLRDELQAALFSLHLSQTTYVELRLSSNLGKERYQLAKEFRDRLEQIPDRAFDYIATLGSNSYWERVRLQFPNMIRFLHAKTRVGVEEDTATINAVLPLPAAHNLVFGSEMILMSNPGVAATAVAAKPGPMAGSAGGLTPAKMTVDDILANYKTTVAFEAQSLELALLDIAKDVNEALKGLPFEFKIKIAGEDLRLDGITRNQTVRDFAQRDKSLAEILTAMVMKANPVTTVKEPSEKDQKLLWVVEKDPDDPNKQIVLITTRQVSEQKGYKLPPPFQLKK